MTGSMFSNILIRYFSSHPEGSWAVKSKFFNSILFFFHSNTSFLDNMSTLEIFNWISSSFFNVTHFAVTFFTTPTCVFPEYKSFRPTSLPIDFVRIFAFWLNMPMALSERINASLRSSIWLDDFIIFFTKSSSLPSSISLDRYIPSLINVLRAEDVSLLFFCME